MPSLNKCIFIGNIGKIETRYMPSGEAVVQFSLAVNESYKNKSGEKIEKTEWVNAVAYRKLAEIISEYAKVGTLLYIEGKMQTKKWEKDGITRYATEVVVDEMQMLGSKSEGQDTKPAAKPAQSKPPVQKDKTGFEDFDQEIPF